LLLDTAAKVVRNLESDSRFVERMVAGDVFT